MSTSQTLSLEGIGKFLQCLWDSPSSASCTWIWPQHVTYKQMGLSSDELAKEGGDVLLDKGQEDHSGMAQCLEF